MKKKVFVVVIDYCYDSDPEVYVEGVYNKREDALKVVEDRRSSNISNFDEDEIYHDEEDCFDAFDRMSYRYRVRVTEHDTK